MMSSSIVKFESDAVIDRFLSNVDVWQTILEMLEVKDRIRVEMTNKRLGIMIFDYWKRVTSFDSKNCLREMSDKSATLKNLEKRWAVFAIICVNRIGDGLRSLTISERLIPVPFWSENLRYISEGCPNVETINFVFENEYGTLHIRFDSFSRLKTITVSPYMINASASVFLRIPTSIEVIRGLKGKWDEPFENAAQMEGFFANRLSLREICLDELCTRDKSKADIFRVIAERCPHLKSIKLSYTYNNCIDYRGVIALESMKELRMPLAFYLDEMQVVTICERSPLVEVLEFKLRFSSNIHLQSAALNALGALTKLTDLCLNIHYYEDAPEVAPSLVTEFVRELARNSGASLRQLQIGNCDMPLQTAAIEALANGCGKLRSVQFDVHVGEAEPASIRFLIDCIVADPSWITQTDQPTLVIIVGVIRDRGDEAEARLAALKALAGPAANLPAGVELDIG